MFDSFFLHFSVIDVVIANFLMNQLSAMGDGCVPVLLFPMVCMNLGSSFRLAGACGRSVSFCLCV